MGDLARPSLPAGFELKRALRKNKKEINHAAWSADGDLLAVASSEHAITLWDTMNGAELPQLTGADTKYLTGPFEGKGLTMRTVTWSPDSRLIAGHGTELYIWDRKEPDAPRVMRGPSFGFNSAWSPDGKMFAAERFDDPRGPSTIQIWDGRVESPLREFRSGDHGIFSTIRNPRLGRPAICSDLKWSPEGNVLASTSGSYVKLWDPTTGKSLWETNQGRDLIGCLAWTPDGNLLASGSNDKKIRLWHPKSGDLASILEGHNDLVTSISFSHDGRFMASQSYLSTSILWELDHGGIFKAITEMPTGKIGMKYLGPLFNPKKPTLMTFAEKNTSIQPWTVAPIATTRDSLGAFSSGPSAPVDEMGIAVSKVETEGGFDPSNRDEARQRILASIVRRQGQPRFRNNLIAAYGRQCVISGTDAEEALEAAHISPYRGNDTNDPTNGLLLRADIHTLFDRHLISVNPKTNTVAVAAQLLGTYYERFAGKRLTLPRSNDERPSTRALAEHYEEFLSKRGIVP